VSLTGRLIAGGTCCLLLPLPLLLLLLLLF
jgi:hypothetical protein